MRLIDGFYVDENRNRWNALYESAESADLKSKSLINCIDCSDCNSCIDCIDCSSCSYCSSCSSCSYCSDCSSCSYCSDYKINPNRYAIKNLGSRHRNTCIYWVGFENIQVVCGCFKGNIDDFSIAVTKKYGENHEYHDYIRKAKMLIGDRGGRK